jgi:hypothetical protein
MPTRKAKAQRFSDWGYSVEFTLRKNDREARVCSAWIARTGEGFPRLISCYVI